MNKKSVITVRRVMQIMSLMCIVIFFCPTMLVSCSGYGLEISAKDAVVGSYGEYQMGKNYPIMIITLIIPVVVMILLFLRNSVKDKNGGIIISLLMVTDIFMWFIYCFTVKDIAEQAFGEAKPTGFYILNMILMFGILISSLLVVFGLIKYDDTPQSVYHSLSAKRRSNNSVIKFSQHEPPVTSDKVSFAETALSNEQKRICSDASKKPKLSKQKRDMLDVFDSISFILLLLFSCIIVGVFIWKYSFNFSEVLQDIQTWYNSCENAADFFEFYASIIVALCYPFTFIASIKEFAMDKG